MSNNPKYKCFHCNKKIKLINFKCKCEQLFCSTCRFPEIHNCTFDFQSKGKELLENKLEVIVKDKIIRI